LLALRNGWTSSQSQFNSGNPAAGVQGGGVYLAGSMHQPSSATGNHFATLPRGLRPSHVTVIPAYTDNGTAGAIAVETTGAMFVYGHGPESAYTSLAGISFPVTSVRFHNLSLVSGWGPGPGVLGLKPAAGIQNGIVYLAGGVHHTSGTSDRFATLPRAFRPAHNLWLPVITAGGGIQGIEIARNGQMFDFGGDAGLSGISFPVNS
jgi:hypothetical protein